MQDRRSVEQVVGTMILIHLKQKYEADGMKSVYISHFTTHEKHLVSGVGYCKYVTVVVLLSCLLSITDNSYNLKNL